MFNSNSTTANDWPFLCDGGKTGELIRSIDWDNNPLGNPSQWSHALRTTIGILLHSQQPMFLWWGPKLIQFYNDAYAVSLEPDKQPKAMGQCGADCWQETWSVILPQIDNVMSRGISSRREDQLVSVWRNDRIEDAYWTYGYSPVFDDVGAVGGTLVICTETTAKVLSERRSSIQRTLRESEPALRHADRNMDEFIAVLAHELRNPLAALSAASNLLSRAAQRPDIAHKAHQALRHQVQHMARLLDDLLDVSRLTHGRLALHKEHLLLTQALDTAIEATKHLMESRRHQLNTELPSEPIYLEADQVRLTQMLSNLLTNAANYTDEGGVIGVHVNMQNGQAVISVKDNGIGIAPELLPTIFERFSFASPQGHRSVSGLGTGLFIVHGLSRLHGGTIEARSAGLGQGSEFILQLPVTGGKGSSFSSTIRSDAISLA